MIFKFFLENTEIDEPVGFDATKMKLTRSENYHGIIAETDSQSVEFYGIAYQILKQEYDEKGIDAAIGFTIKYSCDNGFETLGEYSVTFYNSEWYCGDDCYCKVGLERKGCIYQLKNGMDTKVNLESIVGIDGTTSIGDYEYLGKDITIPPKGVVLTDSAESNDVFSGGFTVGNSVGSGNPLDYTDYLMIPYPKVILEEHNIFSPLDTLIQGSSVDVESNYIYKAAQAETYNITTTFSVAILQNGTTWFHNQCGFEIWKKSGGVQSIIHSESFPQYDGNPASPTSYTINVNYSDSFNLLVNDMIAVVFKIRAWVDTDDLCPLEFDVLEGSKFNINYISTSEPTECKTYMINEALSKTSEYVTNGCLRVYSEYLGRTDSEPYNFDNDGCGGMLALTKGQLLRQLNVILTGDQTPIFSLSFMDIIKALDSIYGIGYTIEMQGDEEVLRVEDWQYFYQNNILADIGLVSIAKKPNIKLHFKRVRTGYSKYEAEEYNGIDEFLTEREYSTKLVNHNAVAEKVCDFIASGYAIELTRRLSYTDTKDWRFDNDTFVICTKRDGLDIIVEQGNIISPANIIDPYTILNFRISPARMAMNLFKYLTTFIKGTKELIFSNGKGNIAAQGELDSVCSIESGVISEKQNLTQTDFAGGQSGIFTAELHEIENVPLTFEQYKTIRANPHGLIAYKCDDTQLYGWIQSLEYSFVDGDATLILIPKNA